ncbi:DinB superfamily protein [Novipirellula galeiformis]|uniref:DinB superfamily protein n=1 Tax=Novipirellula galeiformis TaxID=2528004 RepID=A0A5C6BZX3_9BACT|nr:DinB family protein [Novipirellula galeiformis]TWU17428.1 DinB superfamily protein [Novipirellula galeiformis]
MTRISSRRPTHDETTSTYQRELIQRVPGDCVLQALDRQLHCIAELGSSICADQTDKIHPPYGWSIRQVVEHCANGERIFGYRILCFAAGDSTALPGWDENAYADSRFGLGKFIQIVDELTALRQANMALLRRITPSAWDRSGVADQQTVTVRALAWLTAGHLQHHLEIVAKRCKVSLRLSDSM